METINLINKEPLVEIYSTGSETIFYHESKLEVFDKDVTFIVGFDINDMVSSLSLSDELSKNELSQVTSILLASNCLTTCTRANGCSDKSTSVGSLICVGECVVDCTQTLLEEMREDTNPQ